MSNLANLIKEINDQISTVSTSFVYYDKETGKIQKISNKKEEYKDFECFKIETEVVKDIILGKKKSDNFVVTYDLFEKRLTVKEASYESELGSELNSIRYKLYEIPNTEDSNYDVKIIQDFKKKCWRIKLGKETIKELKNSRYNSNDLIYFSITQKHNPNILYKALEIKLKELLNDEIVYEFSYDWEFNKSDISIYTPKFFKSYIYEVIDVE